MNYEVDETEVENTDLLAVREDNKFSDDEIENLYVESLDCEGSITVCGIEFDPSTILRECDPTAFNCGLNDFDSNTQEVVYVCPICGENHEDEDEAKVCCQDEYITKYIIIDDEGEEYDSELVFDDETEAEEYIENNLAEEEEV